MNDKQALFYDYTSVKFESFEELEPGTTQHRQLNQILEFMIY